MISLIIRDKSFSENYYSDNFSLINLIYEIISFMVRIPWSMRTEAYNLRVCSNILLSVETIANEWKTIDILYVELMYRKYVPSYFL